MAGPLRPSPQAHPHGAGVGQKKTLKYKAFPQFLCACALERLMPIYAYKCSACGHAQDVLQKISDKPLSVCPQCGQSTYSKQVTAAGFQLKGSGWYVSDFRDKGKAPAASATPSSDSSAPAGSTTPSDSTTSSSSTTSSNSTTPSAASGT